MKTKRYEGFSLIEILVVVALIIILATITIVAINPGKNFRDTRNAQRSSDVNALLSAVTQYTTDGNALPTGIAACTETGDDAWKEGTAIRTDATGGVNLSFLTTGENDYMVSIPKDPQVDTEDAGATGYVICSIGTRVQIAAPMAEDEKVIVVKR